MIRQSRGLELLTIFMQMKVSLFLMPLNLAKIFCDISNTSTVEEQKTVTILMLLTPCVQNQKSINRTLIDGMKG
jgi:hypothetical protein